MKKLLLLLLFVAGFSQLSVAQSIIFSFDSIWAPPYICQASHFDVEVFGTVADGSIQYGTQSFSVRNDTILVQFQFVTGPGPAMPYPLYRKINIPAPFAFGHYKIVAQGIYNGQILQTSTSKISICAGTLGIPEKKDPGLNLHLYPNPVEQIMHVELPLFNTSGQISLTDATGKLLFTKKINPNTAFLSLDLQKLPGGIYFVQYQNPDVLLSKKIVKP